MQKKLIELSYEAIAFSGNYMVLSNLLGHLRPYLNILCNFDNTFMIYNCQVDEAKKLFLEHE